MNRRTLLASIPQALLGLGFTLPARHAFAESSLRVLDVEVGDKKALVNRARLLIPRSEQARRRVLFLLHGRGEVGNVPLALKAWPELYGLVETDARLRAGKVAPTLAPEEPSYTPPERLAELQAGLDARPYRGLTFVCPMTPNPSAHGSRTKTYDSYAEWLTRDLLPRVRQELPTAKSFGIVGCSMGGPIALETYLRYPDHFASVGMVQGAFGAFRAPGYASRLKEAFDRHGPKALHFLTSTKDAFLEGNRALSGELEKHGIRAQLDVPSGPHNQPFLRQIGTLLMLRFHDAALAG